MSLNRSRLQKAIAPVIEKHPGAQIRLVILDLTLLASVRRAAQAISSDNEPIHVGRFLYDRLGLARNTYT